MSLHGIKQPLERAFTRRHAVNIGGIGPPAGCFQRFRHGQWTGEPASVRNHVKKLGDNLRSDCKKASTGLQLCNGFLAPSCDGCSTTTMATRKLVSKPWVISLPVGSHFIVPLIPAAQGLEQCPQIDRPYFQQAVGTQL